MAITATFLSGTGMLVLCGDTGSAPSGRPFGGGDSDRLIWNLRNAGDVAEGGADSAAVPLDGGFGHDAFTITAAGGQVRAFRAFLDQPRYRRPRRRRLV
jgi:hypothetical protein